MSAYGGLLDPVGMPGVAGAVSAKAALGFPVLGEPGGMGGVFMVFSSFQGVRARFRRRRKATTIRGRRVAIRLEVAFMRLGPAPLAPATHLHATFNIYFTSTSETVSRNRHALVRWQSPMGLRQLGSSNAEVGRSKSGLSSSNRPRPTDRTELDSPDRGRPCDRVS